MDQQLVQISLGVISLTSVLGSAYFSYRTHKNKSEQKDKELQQLHEEKFRQDLLDMIEDLQARLKMLEESNTLLRKEIYSAEKKIQELETIIEEQFDTISVLGSFCKYIPAPVWVKKIHENGKTTMYFINRFYEEQWGISAEFYIGKEDVEVWGPDIAKHFDEADAYVLKYKKGASFIENIPVDPFDINKGTRKSLIWKFPVVNNQKLIGIGGILIDIDDYILQKSQQ